MSALVTAKVSNVLTNSFDDWTQMLTLFSKASGLIATLYLPTGERILGPFQGPGFGKYLIESKHFEYGGSFHVYESNKVRKSCENLDFKDTKFGNALVVKMLPLFANGEIVAVIVYGWAF